MRRGRSTCLASSVTLLSGLIAADAASIASGGKHLSAESGRLSSTYRNNTIVSAPLHHSISNKPILVKYKIMAVTKNPMSLLKLEQTPEAMLGTPVC